MTITRNSARAERMAPREDLHLYSVSGGVPRANRTRLSRFADERLDHLACGTMARAVGVEPTFAVLETALFPERARKMALLQGIEPRFGD